MESDLLTGKMVEGQNTSTAVRTGDTKESAGTVQSSAFNFSQDNAQYFVDMMRMQMLSRAGTLSRGFWSTDESDVIL